MKVRRIGTTDRCGVMHGIVFLNSAIRAAEFPARVIVDGHGEVVDPTKEISLVGWDYLSI